MSRATFAALLAVALLAAFPAAALQPAPMPGDGVVVTLTSGLTFRGQLISRGERTLTLRSSAGSVRELPLASVKDVVAEADTPPAAAEPGAAAAAVPAPSSGPAVAATGTSNGTIPAAPTRTTSAPEAMALGGPGEVQVGLGVSLTSVGGAVFYVPIRLGRTFRIEPEIGFLSLGGSSSAGRVLQLGVGLLATGQVEPQVGWYGGLRFQVRTFNAGSQGYDRTVERLALIAGAEWQPLSRVAFGVEAQIGYEFVDAGSPSTQPGLGSAGLAFLRIYLN
jgi:hypothetical protein